MSGDQIPLTPLDLHRVAPVVQDLLMAVFCAVCEGTMRPGEHFVLKDQYVVHARCTQGVIKEKAYLERVRHQVAELDLAVSKERQGAERDLKRANEDLARWRDRARAAEDRAKTAEEAHLYWVQRAAIKDEEILRLQEQLAAQRRATLPQPVPVASGEISPPEPVKEAAPDDTATRFRLLEFD